MTKSSYGTRWLAAVALYNTLLFASVPKRPLNSFTRGESELKIDDDDIQDVLYLVAAAHKELQNNEGSEIDNESPCKVPVSTQ